MGCVPLCSNNAVQQIYPIEHNQISIPPEIDKDNVIKAIFPDSEIKKVTETVSDNGWEYLVIGKKWAVGPASEIDLPADYNPLAKYVSIKRILKAKVFPGENDQIVVTIDIVCLQTSAGGTYRYALIILDQKPDGYKIRAEAYQQGRIIATIPNDINNDGRMEIALVVDISTFHSWGGKALHLYQAEGNSLLEILGMREAAEVEGWDYGGGEEYLSDYKTRLELGENKKDGYRSIIKTGLLILYKSDSPFREETTPVRIVRVIKETLDWNGKKYALSSKQTLLEFKPYGSSESPEQEPQSPPK